MMGCFHNADMGLDYPCARCVVLTPEQAEYGERLRSVSWAFSGGTSWRDGPTIGEGLREVREHAKRTGVEPQYEGPKSRWV